MKQLRAILMRKGWILWLMAGLAASRAADAADTEKQLRDLLEQNQALRQQMQRQQGLIESLSQKISDLQKAREQHDAELQALKGELKQPSSEPGEATKTGFLNQVHLNAEGGLAFFHSGSDGQFRNAEFRVDEAKLFLEAHVWKDAFFFSELNVVTREQNPTDETFHLGEIYLEVEEISKLWHQEHQLNLRFGRIDIPFGEEYLTRDAIDNPLISHSLSDIWGVDEGIELYGSIQRIQYALAVQNGGRPMLRDFNSDKAVVGRVGYNPAKWLHVSASAMRTGDLDSAGDRDKYSEVWFGNGFFRALGRGATTTTLHAELFEGDVQAHFQRGQIQVAGGHVRFDDDDRARDNRREINYYYVEGLVNVLPKFYVASRFSQIFAGRGYPLAAQADAGSYFYSPFAPLTKELWRLSLGAGYRWSQNLVLKVEYSLERGKTTAGDKRDHEDIFGVEAAFKF
jgi:hypothetical protein